MSMVRLSLEYVVSNGTFYSLSLFTYFLLLDLIHFHTPIRKHISFDTSEHFVIIYHLVMVCICKVEQFLNHKLKFGTTAQLCGTKLIDFEYAAKREFPWHLILYFMITAFNKSCLKWKLIYARVFCQRRPKVARPRDSLHIFSHSVRP